MIRDGQDRPEEVGVAEVGAEGLVGRARLLPGIPAAGEVDENDAEGPDVVVQGRVGAQALKEAALAFCATRTEISLCEFCSRWREHEPGDM